MDPDENGCFTSREVDSIVTDESEETESENIEDEEEIDVVSVQSAPVRAHQRNLSAHAASAQRSLLKTKNLQKAAAHKQRKQKSSASAPATPYLLTPVQSPQPSNPAGPIEYPMPKVRFLLDQVPNLGGLGSLSVQSRSLLSLLRSFERSNPAMQRGLKRSFSGTSSITGSLAGSFARPEKKRHRMWDREDLGRTKKLAALIAARACTNGALLSR